MNKYLASQRFWLLVFVGIFFLHLLTLLRYPAPFIDEAWLLSRSWAFVHTGHQYGQLDSGLGEYVFSGIWTVNQWLIIALQALVLRFFAHPELLPLRVLSLTLGFGLLAASYLIAARLCGKAVAITSTLLLALSSAFFYSAHLVRYDILATFFGYAALAFAVNDRQGRFWSGLAAGVLVGLAVETHLNSLIFLLAIAVYYMCEYSGMFYRKASTWGFILGCTFGAVYYLMLHVLPYPETYTRVNSLVFGKTHLPPLLSLDIGRILQGFADAGSLLLVASSSMLVLGLLGILLLARRRQKAGLEVLAINITLIVGAALVIPNKIGHYGIYLTPAFLWLTAEFLVDFAHKPWQGKIGDYASRVLVWGLVAGALAIAFKPLLTDHYQAYKQAQEQINQVVMPGDTLMGTQVFWLGLYDHRYYSWELLYLYPRFYAGKTLEDTLEFYRPDMLIIDQPTDDLISDTIDPSSRWYYYHLSRKEFYKFLAEHTHLVLQVDNTPYGTIRVYRILWKQ